MQRRAFQFSRRNVLAASAKLVGCSLAGAGRAQTRALEKVDIVNASGNLTTTIQELMTQQGFLARFDLMSQPVYVQDGSKLMGSLLAGDMDLCPLSGFSQVFPAVERGARLKLTNVSVRLGQQAIFSANPKVQTVADLKGKTIGAGSINAQLYQVTVAILLKNGVDPSTVTFANVGSSSDVFRAVAAKVVDAGPAQIDVIPEAEKLGVHRVKGGDMWTDLRQYPFQGGFASDAVIAGKRELLVRTLAAYATLFRFLSGPDSRDAFRAARRKALSKSGQAFDAASDFQWNFMQKVQPFALDLLLPPEGADFIQNLNVRLGIQKKKLPYDSVADMSLARDALKMI